MKINMEFTTEQLDRAITKFTAEKVRLSKQLSLMLFNEGITDRYEALSERIAGLDIEIERAEHLKQRIKSQGLWDWLSE